MPRGSPVPGLLRTDRGSDIPVTIHLAEPVDRDDADRAPPEPRIARYAR